MESKLIEFTALEEDSPFLEYERHLRRAIVEAFGVPAQKSIDFRAGFENDVLSPLYQDALDSLGWGRRSATGNDIDGSQVSSPRPDAGEA